MSKSRELAAKMPSPKLSAHKVEAEVKLLIKEGHIIKAIAHPEYISKIFEEIIDYNPTNDKISNYVMIIERGLTDLSHLSKIWKDLAESEKLSEHFSHEKAVVLFLKAAEALAWVHSQHIYFGDMNPLNVLIFKDLSVKLGNFASAIKKPKSEGFDYITNANGLN